MASSPKGIKSGVLGWAGRDALSLACVTLGGMLCCALLALQLHQRRTPSASAPGEAAPTTASRLGPGQNLLPGAWTFAEPAGGAKGGPLFALVPRPARLEPLPESSRRAGPGRPMLWRHTASWGHEPAQLAAGLLGLEGLVNATARELPTLDLVPEGAVVAALLPSTQEAITACRSLVGYDGATGRKPLVHNIAPALRAEWHFAILWNGRLAICGVEPVGVFRFTATLRQMLHGRGEVSMLQALPSFLLEDWPQYTWRGLQLDCVRHFMPLDFIKRYLSAMAYFKANAFHWHLTDDQAWRLYIPSRPKLVGSNKWSPDYYSTEDVREIVDFAAGLFITVLPTIETPGHCLAALAAYPELACEGDHFEVPKTRVGTYSDIMCVGKKAVADFAHDVFAEVAKLFPGPYVHVGGDEVLTTRWQHSRHTKAFAGMAGLGNLGPDLMEAWYCHISQLLKGFGRTMVMWDDHFEQRQWHVKHKCPNAAKDWIVQAWKLEYPVGGFDKAVVSHNWPFRTIASPMKTAYLDYPVASIDYNKTLEWHLGGREGGMLGGCANMWTEDSEPKDVGAKVYPRYLGLAERLWNAPARGRPVPDWERPLDLTSHRAASRHCEEGSALRQEFGFACGKFERMVNGRSETWQGAEVSTSIDQYAEAYSPERALDDDVESYFWGIAPKLGDIFEVTFVLRGQRQVGKWFRRIVVSTGAKDRPGDRLENGELQVAQWVRLDDKDDGPPLYKLKIRTVAKFVEGVATAEGQDLVEAPVMTVRILCKEYQTKWMALTEITAEEGTPLEHPTQEDITVSEAHVRKERRVHGERHQRAPDTAMHDELR